MTHAENSWPGDGLEDGTGMGDGAGMDENIVLVESNVPDDGQRPDETPGTATGFSETAGSGTTAGPGTTTAAGADDRFVARWREIQAGFVDDPGQAVRDADALIADMMERLAQLLASEREQLKPRGGSGDDVSTEDLRQGLRRYRSLFERLLAV